MLPGHGIGLPSLPGNHDMLKVARLLGAEVDRYDDMVECVVPLPPPDGRSLAREDLEEQIGEWHNSPAGHGDVSFAFSHDPEAALADAPSRRHLDATCPSWPAI